MSELLLHWLNNSLQLSKFVTDVEADFASGYLLGELLHRLNQQHNFSDFMDSAIADAKIINFCLLEPTMRHLNIKFDANIATSIMNGKSGSAANVLYQIKMAADRLARAPPVSTKSLERTNIQPLHNMPTKLAKPAYNAANHYFFEHSIRRQVKSLGGLKREREAIEAEKREKEAYKERQARLQEQLEITKAERLHQAFIHTQYIKTALDETDSPAWRLAIEKKHEREHRRASFYQQLTAKLDRREQEVTYSLRNTVEKDLDDFDYRRSSGLKGDPTKNKTTTKSRNSIGYGLRSLSTMLETKPTVDPSELRDPSKPVAVGETTQEHVNDTTAIRDQKRNRERRQEQLERRRRRFLQESLHQQTHTNAAHATHALEDLVQRHTSHEDVSKHEMTRILIYKEIATENRIRREERYTHRKETDANEEIDRDTASFELLFAKYNDDVATQTMQSSYRIVAREAAQKHENQLVVGLLLQEIVDFSMFIAGKREDSMHSRDSLTFLPTESTWEEYLHVFANVGPHDVEPEYATDGLPQHQLITYLRSFEQPSFFSNDYVGAVAKGIALSPWVPSDWKFVAAVEILEDRYILGETVKYLRWLAHATNPPPAAPTRQSESNPKLITVADSVVAAETDTATASSEAVIESLKSPNQVQDDIPVQEPELPRLQIMVFGPPFAGKTSQAKLLADKYDLALISVEKALQSAIKDESPAGVEAQRVLMDGGELSPDLYSLLAMDSLRKLDVRHRHRWIVCDMPSTHAHAKSFEEHLTGFVDPAKIPSPFDFESILAPGIVKPNLPKTFLYGKSGVDLVFYLDCAESAIVERCLGQMEDFATSDRSNHLLFSPPPFDSTSRHRLRHVNDSSNASELLSLQWLSTKDYADSQNAWFTAFDTLRQIATTESQQGQSVAITRSLTAEATHERLIEVVESFFEQQRVDEVSKQQDAEYQEALRMQEEEHRQLKIAELKLRITEAQQDVTKAQQAVQQAEEAKAKKEEIAELKTGIETAKKHVETALVAARDWLMDEGLRSKNSRTTYSAQLHPPLASVLASSWDTMETEYVAAMRRFFKLQRQQRSRIETRVLWMLERVTAFARRVDRKQSVLTAFQTQFNSVVEEMRFDDATKLELHARSDVLQDELNSLIDTKQRESEEELRDIMGDGWIEDSCQMIAVLFIRALQAECDRFVVTVQLLVDSFLAASDEPAQLAGIREHLINHSHVLSEFSLKPFRDAAVETAATAATPAASAPAPAAKAGAKAPAKGKPPLVPTPSVHAGVMPDASAVGDALSVEGLLTQYDNVVQRCDGLIQLITSAPPKLPEVAKPPEPVAPPPKAGKTGNTPAATPTATPASSVVLIPRQTIDVATSNFLKAIKYEHELMARRVRFLKDAVQSACDHVARSIRSVESTLRGVIEERAVREQAAAASVVTHIRHTIEAETNLPFFIDIQPEQVYRFPSTGHLIEDTRATIDSNSRLLPRAPVIPPPDIELQDHSLVNDRQASLIREQLSPEGYAMIPICDALHILVSLASVPHALPSAWATSDADTVAEVVSRFVVAESGMVDIHALVDAMATDRTLLPAATSSVDTN